MTVIGAQASLARSIINYDIKYRMGDELTES